MIIFTITTINVTLKYAFHILHNHKIWISNVNVLIFNFKNHLFHLANGVFFYLFHLTFWHNLFPTITVSHSHTNTIPYITKSLSMSMSSWISHNSLPHLTIWILNKCRIEFIPHITNINVFVNFTQITVAKRGGVREKIHVVVIKCKSIDAEARGVILLFEKRIDILPASTYVIDYALINLVSIMGLSWRPKENFQLSGLWTLWTCVFSVPVGPLRINLAGTKVNATSYQLPPVAPGAVIHILEKPRSLCHTSSSGRKRRGQSASPRRPSH